MTVESEIRRPRFDGTSPDNAPLPHFAPADDGFRLPPLDPTAYQPPNANDGLAKLIAAALEDPVVEASLEEDATFGPVIKPHGSSLHDHKHILSEGFGSCDIRFSAATYGIFDGVIVKTCGLDLKGQPLHAAFAPRHAHYAYYAPLRRNLAILRNYLMLRHPPGGEANKGNQLILRMMAEKLGFALRGPVKELSLLMKLLMRFREIMMGAPPVKPHQNRFLDLANTPDRGIAFLYNYLYLLQAEPAFMGALPPLSWPKNWQFLPLEQTPFSSLNMLYHSDAARMMNLTTAFDQLNEQFKPVAEMDAAAREEAVEIARDILRSMRIYPTGKREEKGQDAADPRHREARVMLQSAASFASALAELRKTDPEALNDPTLKDAEEAVGKINYRVQAENKAMAKAENRMELEQATEKRIAGVSSRYKTKEPIGQLLHKLEAGMQRIGEIHRQITGRTKQKATIANVLNRQNPAQQALKEGMNTMSGPKIHQVSSSDPDLMKSIRQANEPTAEQEKANPGDKGNLGRG